jgi:hypothetical protein
MSSLTPGMLGNMERGCTGEIFQDGDKRSEDMDLVSRGGFQDGSFFGSADNHSEIDPPDGNDAEWHAQAPQLLNITIFAANLMLRADRRPNVSFPASIAMNDGVDKPYDDTRELKDEWRMYVPPAATWILIAGSKIRELCFMDALPEEDNGHTARLQWGGRTYCPGRWMFWKQRFQQLAEDTAIDVQCHEYAKQAFEYMDKLDGET